MIQYFYTDGNQKFGPFSLEDLTKENLDRDTKVWFYGLDSWIEISKIDELKFIINHLPPEIKHSEPFLDNLKKIKPEPQASFKMSFNKKKWLVGFGCIIIVFVIYHFLKEDKEHKLYNQIAESSYDSETDFQPYIDKFYRDAEVFGLFPQKPKTTIVKFAKLDQLKNTTHFHGVSFGFEDDEKIEIYINPSTWKKFNKPMRYYLIYHELAHDILNADDLNHEILNEGKLMYPAISSFESITMDDFIESSHRFFEEISGNNLMEGF